MLVVVVVVVEVEVLTNTRKVARNCDININNAKKSILLLS